MATEAQLELLRALAPGVSYLSKPCTTVVTQWQAVKLNSDGTVSACETTDTDTDIFGIALIGRGVGDPGFILVSRDMRFPLCVLNDGVGAITCGDFLTLSTTVAGRFAVGSGGGVFTATQAAPATADYKCEAIFEGNGVSSGISVSLQSAYNGGKTIVETTGTNPVALSSPDSTATLITFASGGGGSGGGIQAITGALKVYATRELNLWAGDATGSNDGYEVHVYGGDGSGASHVGGNVLILGGNAGESGNAAGGNVLIGGGQHVGSGAQGYVQISDGSGNTLIRVSDNAVRMLLDNTIDADLTWTADSSGTATLKPAANTQINISGNGGSYYFAVSDSIGVQMRGGSGYVKFDAANFYVLLNGQSSSAIEANNTTVKLRSGDTERFHVNADEIRGYAPDGSIRFTFDANYSIINHSFQSVRVTSSQIVMLAGNAGNTGFTVDGTDGAGVVKISWFGASVVAQQAVAALTNNITSGGTNNQLDNWTSLTVYSTDAAAIRNAVYQCGRSIGLMRTAMANYGLVS